MHGVRSCSAIISAIRNLHVCKVMDAGQRQGPVTSRSATPFMLDVTKADASLGASPVHLWQHRLDQIIKQRLVRLADESS